MPSFGGPTPPRVQRPGADQPAHVAAADAPCVSIGLPVYNGERYLAQSIESLLAQTFEDFELILCDNASTDATESICRDFAARDPRIRYVRNNRNIGACPNFNRAFEYARGRYFAWAAHDDYRAPGYLAACVAVLESDPSVVLCHTQTQVIDEDGKLLGVCHSEGGGGAGSPQRWEVCDPPRRLDSPDAAVRLHDVLVPTRWCFEVFGLMRAAALRRTPKLLSFYGSDKVLLAAMALRGRFHEVPAPLFFRRDHPGQSSAKSRREQAAWADARARRPVVPPQARCFGWYVRLVAGANLGAAQRLRCLAAVGRWVAHLGMLVVRQRKHRGFLHRVVYRPFQRRKLVPRYL